MTDDSVTRLARDRRFCEGWLEHKAHRPTGYRYEKLFALLEDNIIYIFSTNRPSQETQIGNLTLDSNAELTLRGGNASKGFKFDLSTGKRLNRFKTKKSTERELWRAYIIGISKGYVPKDLDLLDSEVTRIEREVAAYHAGDQCDYDPKRTSIASRRSIQSKIDSGVVSLGGRSGSSGEDSRSSTSASAISSASGTLTHGGPTMVHKYYNDHNREQEPPSWFFPHCSRETAEKLLEKAHSMNYGNTLMRESTSHLSNGSYVITKFSTNTRDGTFEFEHFEVIRTAKGYKVNVQNPHDPMRCLSDVMDYFVRTSGGSTHPLLVNDLNVLGQDTPGYATQIHTRASEPWVWPPPDSKDEPMPDGPRQNYDQPDSPRQRNQARIIDGSQTVTAGILRDRSLPSPATERKSVGWSSVIRTPPPVHFQTYSGRRTKQEQGPSMAELVQRSKEADQLQELDTMLGGFESGFERNSIYVNSPGYGNKATPCQPPPPPPAPHLPQRPRSYVNVNTGSEPHDPDLEALPVAPPAPRDPIVSPPSSVSSIRNSISITSPSAATSSTPSPAASVKLRNSLSSSSTKSHTAQNRQQFTKSLSENQLRSVSNVRSPDSPKNFPAWNSPKEGTNVLHQTKKPEVPKEGSAKSEEPKAGIDGTDPGGVSTLRSKFEVSSKASAAASKPGRTRSSLPVRWSLSSNMSQTMEELDDLYEYLSEDGHIQTNNSLPTTNTTNKLPIKNSQSMVDSYETNQGSLLAVGRSQSVKTISNQTKTAEMTYDNRQRPPEPEDDFYDDTAIPDEQQSAERKVQFPSNKQSSPPNPDNKRILSRRQTEPALPVTQNQTFEGLNPDFKKKLEGMFGAGTVGPSVGKGPKLAVQHARTTSAEDHIYAELPEEIPPDGVFYANERYNVGKDNT